MNVYAKNEFSEPKSKRGRPRKNKTPTERTDSVGEYKEDKSRISGTSKKKRSRNPRKSNEEQKGDREDNKPMEFSGEEPRESEENKTSEEQEERRITEPSVDEEKSGEECDKVRHKNPRIREGTKRIKKRLMKKDDYEEARAYLMKRKYKAETQNKPEDIKRYDYMLQKIENHSIII